MKRAFTGPALLGLTILVLGGGGMALLLAFKHTPAEATLERDEKPIHVAIQTVQPEEAPVHIQGYGQVAARKTVTITPQVSGSVVSVHPELVVGGLIAEGALLFALDPRPYEARVTDTQAQLAGQESALLRLQTEERHLAADLKNMKRNGELAEQRFARAKKLHAEGIGSQSTVDDAERALVDTRNDIDQRNRSLALYPIRIQESESNIASARAQLDMAQLSLEHTRVVAPFTGRVKTVNLEENEVVSMGSPAVVLVDDSVLEISVPLNSQDVRTWLQFEAHDDAKPTGWFGDLKPVTCQIRWTEEEAERHWEGTLHRVAAFEQESRTLTVVVRIEGSQARAADRFPLVEGMFCAVSIPGRPMKNVYRLEPHVVSFENTVFVADVDRLKTVSVTVARIEEDYTYVSGGLHPGDRVITTRLVNPLDHSLLAITETSAESAP
jgi:multidrug efflux pump subunit AcrA (membrane-fusion protein)